MHLCSLVLATAPLFFKTRIGIKVFKKSLLLILGLVMKGTREAKNMYVITTRGRFFPTLAKFCPLLTTYLPQVDSAPYCPISI